MGQENEKYFQNTIQGSGGKLKTTRERWDTSHKTAQALGNGRILGIPAAERLCGPSQLQPGWGPGSPHTTPKTGQQHELWGQNGLFPSSKAWGQKGKHKGRNKIKFKRNKQLRAGTAIQLCCELFGRRRGEHLAVLNLPTWKLRTY